MAVAGCTTIDPTVMPVPVSPAQAEAALHAVTGSGPVSFLAAFGRAMDAPAQADQHPAAAAQAAGEPASLPLVPAALPVESEQSPSAAVPTPGRGADMPAGQPLPLVTEAADRAQPGVFAGPAVLAEIAGPMSVASGQTPSAAAPAPGPALDVPEHNAFPPVTEAGGRAQSPRLARTASGQLASVGPAGPSHTPSSEVSTPQPCVMPDGRSAIKDPDPQRARPGQARPAQAAPAELFFRLAKPAPNLEDFADAAREGTWPVKSGGVSGAGESSPARASGLGPGQTSEDAAEGQVEPPAAEASEPAMGAEADKRRETAPCVEALRHLPDGLPLAEALSDSTRQAPDSPPPARKAPGVVVACELPTAWKSIPFVTTSTGLKQSAGQREALEVPAQGYPQPARSGLPYLPPSPDRLPAAERGVEACTGYFRPVLLLETAQSPPAIVHPAVRAVDAEAPAQANSTPFTPAGSPDQPPDAFTRPGAGSQQPPAPDPEPRAPISASSGRSAGTYSFVPELARPSSGASTFTDAAASGNAGGATQHFSLQGRPVEAPAVTQPSFSLVFSSADDLYLRLAEKMHLQVREGKNSVRIQLKPDALGRLEIKAESTAAGLTATIVAETHGVKTFLEQNLHNLYRTLQDMGFKVDRILVTEDGSQHRAPDQSGSGDARPGQDRSYPADEPSWLPGDPAARTAPLPAAPAMPGYWKPYSTFHAVA